jgi:formylglycine-generating enzyme required for sulfatase activity
MNPPRSHPRPRARWWYGSLALLALTAATADELQDSKYVPWVSAVASMISGPKCLGMQDGGLQIGAVQCEPDTHAEFLDSIRHWRAMRRSYIGYDGSRYDAAALKWTQSNFIQPQTLVEDRYLYDPIAHRYTIDRFLGDVEKRYGGIDSILLWPVYTNLGIDDRNQLDMIRALPGGVSGVRQMIAEFHRRGIKVLFPMTLWDRGTRDPGKPWPEAIAELMKEIDADGINGDTQDGVPLAFTQAADQLGHPLAFQPENALSDEALAWNLLSWWEEQDPTKYAQFVPPVYRYKWLETRHMANISDRSSRDHTDDLQLAFFNGIGWESWENVWGIWNGITPRDGEATRRMATVERGVARFLTSPEWEPFYPMNVFGVFSSRWPLGQEVVWTIVNRNEYDVDGRQLVVPYRAGERYFDLYHGVEIAGQREGDNVVLAFAIEAHGFGALLVTQDPPDPALVALLAKMRRMTSRPLALYSHEWQPLLQKLVEIAPTRRARTAPPDMVEVPAGAFDFAVQGTEIEGGNAIGVDVSYPWEDSPRRFHARKLAVKRFFMDRYPVSNAKFKTFLEATGYQPKDALNFLRDWKGGSYPDGWGDKPVTWVSIEDARAYADWAGKRLPHEWEWQYAAQGSDHRLYPWGNEWRAAAVPAPEKGRRLRGADAVSGHPEGASPFGVMDLVGNVWQWTDEYLDDHTRSAILRGGSYYQPQGSVWYFPQAYRNDQHSKFLLMAPAKDRAGTLGFRCVVDAE